MANPTTNKPTTAVFDSSAGLGSACKFLLPFTEKGGLPKDYVGNIVPTTPSAGPTGYGSVGRWKNTGFALTPNGGDPAYAFDLGNRTLAYATTASSWATATQKGFWFCFKHRMRRMAALGNTALAPLFVANGSVPIGVNFKISNADVTTLEFQRNSAAIGSGFALSDAYTKDVNYVVMVFFDNTTSPKQIVTRIYNLDTQALVTGAGGTVQTDGSNSQLGSGPTNLVINPNGAGLGGQGLAIELFAFGLFSGVVPSDSDFQTIYQDPVIQARGTYTPSGGLTAGVLSKGNLTDATADLTWTRATGTGTGGTGAPTYTAHVSTDPAFTPGVGNQVYSGSDTKVTVTGLARNTPYYARVVATDGSSTVTFPATSAVPLAFGTLKKPPFTYLNFGDSLIENQNAVSVQGLFLNTQGYRPNIIDRGKSGSVVAAAGTAPTGSFSPGIGPTVYTLSIGTGTPSSGKFNIATAVNGQAAQNTANINFNASASDVQTALEAMSNIGSGNVAVTGSAFPAGTMTVTFQGARATSTVSLSLQAASNTMNNSAVPVFTQSQVGYEKGDQYDDLVAEANAAPAPLVAGHQHGTNDAFPSFSYPAARHQVNLTQLYQKFKLGVVSNHPDVLIVPHAPPYRTDSLTNAILAEFHAYRAVVQAVAQAVPGLSVGTVFELWNLVANDPNLLDSGNVHWNSYTNQAVAHALRAMYAIDPPQANRVVGG